MAKLITLNIIYSVLATMLISSCSGQVKTETSKQETIISVEKSKLIKSRSSNEGDNVHSIIQDKEGFIWFTTTGDGVYRYNGKTFTNYTIENGLNSNCVFSIIQDKAGVIWLGTDKGLSSFDGKVFKHFSVIDNEKRFSSFGKNPKEEIGVSKIIQDRNGIYWLATESGIYRFNGYVFTQFYENPDIENSNRIYPKNIVNIIEDKEGNIWFTTRAEGIYCFTANKINNYKPNNETWFFGLFEDKNGTIWVGSRTSGVFRFDGKAFTKQFQDLDFKNAIVYSMIQDKNGNIWFGTDENKGLWSYDGTTLKNFTTKQGLTNGSVFCIFEDKSGKIWVGARNTSLDSYDGITFTNNSE